MQPAPRTPKEDDGHMTPRGDSKTLKRTRGTSPAPKRDNSVKAPYEEGDNALNRKFGGHIALNKEDDRNPYGDGKNTRNRHKDTHVTSVRDQQYSVRAFRYGGSTTLPHNQCVRKCLTALQADLRREKNISKNTEAKLPELKYPGISKIMVLTGQSDYFCVYQ